MSRKETYDGETKSGKDDEHLRRLREFKKRENQGFFLKILMRKPGILLIIN